MIKFIRKIKFSVESFAQGKKTYLIDESGIAYSEDTGYLMRMPTEITVATCFNQYQEKDLIDLFNNIHFLSWKKEYWFDHYNIFKMFHFPKEN